MAEAEPGTGGSAMTAGRTVVFETHGLGKVYRMGEVEVHALRFWSS